MVANCPANKSFFQRVPSHPEPWGGHNDLSGCRNCNTGSYTPVDPQEEALVSFFLKAAVNLASSNPR